MSNQSVSIIAPVFNEEENILRFYEALVEVISNMDYNYELIFVDDGSSDNSLEKIKELRRGNDKVKFISFSRNFGHQIALIAGYESAMGDCVISIDADLQHPPEVILQLIKEWEEGYEVVHTIRKNENHVPLLKRITASLFYKLINSFTELNIPENAADFRLVDKKVVESLRGFKETHLFLRGLIPFIGFKCTAVGYRVGRRFGGESKYSLIKMFKLAIDGITSFSSSVLLLSFYLGISMSFVGFIYAVYAVCVKIFTDRAFSGWASILVSVLIIGGLQLCFIGVIGLYVSRIFDEVKNRPRYIVKERSQ